MWLKVMKLLLDMLRRINVETDKDPIHDILRRINGLKLNNLLLDMLRRINDEKGRILFMIC